MLRNERGSISVFLALLLTVVLAFTLVLLEGARVEAFKTVARMAAETGVDSLFSVYDETLLHEYGLLFLDSTDENGFEDPKNVEKFVSSYVKSNLSSDFLHLRGTFFRGSKVKTTLEKEVHATDENGEIFILSALKGFKYDGAAALLESIQEDLKAYQKANKKHDQMENKLEKAPDTGEAKLQNMGFFPEGELSDFSIFQLDFRSGFFAQTIPKGIEVSDLSADLSDAPSKLAKQNAASSFSFSLLNKVLFNEYLLTYFPSFTDEDNEKGQRYELEYLISGNASDSKSLSDVLFRLLAIREAMNLLTIETVDEFKESAEAVGTAISSWTGNPVIIDLAKAFVKLVWAYAESVVDIKTLLSGKKIPLIKEKEDWTLFIDHIDQILLSEGEVIAEGKKGMSYEEYLRLLLFLTDANTLSYRAMDMIQVNVREKNPSFQMQLCRYAMQFQITVTGRELFSALPVIKHFHFIKRKYEFSGTVSMSY